MSCCSVDGCWDPIDCKELCGRHRQQMRRYGRIKEVERTPSCLEMLENLTLYVHTDECLAAPFKTRNGTYPELSVNGKMRLAVHVVMEIIGQPRPPKHFVLTTCATEGCVNRRHLRWATGTQVREAALQRADQVGR